MDTTEDFARRPGPSVRLMSTIAAVVEHCAGWRPQSVVAVAALLTGIVFCAVTLGFWSATREAIRQTREQALLAQRPWLIVPKVELLAPLATGHPVRAAASLANTGHSPAVEVVASGMLSLSRSAPGFVSHILGGGERRMDMGASDAQLIYLDLDDRQPINDADLAALSSGKQTLYAIVEVTYNDPFGHTGVTNVCTAYRPAQRDFGPCAIGSELR